jgi:hypothetical protein
MHTLKAVLAPLITLSPLFPIPPQDAAVLVTGTLGLAYPGSRATLHKAVAAAKEGGCKVGGATARQRVTVV